MQPYEHSWCGMLLHPYIQRRQKSLTFETKALMYSNRSYIDTCMRRVESANARLAASARAQKILKEGSTAFVPVVTDDEESASVVVVDDDETTEPTVVYECEDDWDLVEYPST